MECKEYAHHLSRQVIVFPAPPALYLVLLNSLPVSGPAYSSFLSAFVPAAPTQWNVLLPFIPVPQSGEGHLFLEAFHKHSRQRPFLFSPRAVSAFLWQMLGSPTFGVVSDCSCSSLAIPACPSAKGDCSSLEAGIISHQLPASASSVRAAR